MPGCLCSKSKGEATADKEGVGLVHQCEVEPLSNSIPFRSVRGCDLMDDPPLSQGALDLLVAEFTSLISSDKPGEDPELCLQESKEVF